MKGRIITDIGQVSVDTDVIAKYAGMAAVVLILCLQHFQRHMFPVLL